jgi:hypothetical protein
MPLPRTHTIKSYATASVQSMGRILRNAEAGYVQSGPGRRTFRAHLIKTAAEGTAIRREGDAGDGQPLISDTVYGTLVPNCTTAVLKV